MSELNARQWALYNYLKDMGDTWTTQYNIVKALNMLDGFYTKPERENFHDSTARHILTADIRALNDSSVIQKVILSGAKGVKIANAEEFERYIGKEIKAAVRRLMRAKRKAAKGNRDGQMRIVLNGERDTIKAFLDSDKATGERLRSARLKNGWTAKKVVANLQACGIHIDEPLLSKYENGYACPTSRQLAKLAEIYGVEPEYILYGEIVEETETTAKSELVSVGN